MKALITGASSGIGKALAVQLSAMGYETVLVARRADRLAELAKTLKTKAEIEAADLSDKKELERLVKAHPDIDLLVNNAGLGVYGEFSETDFEKESLMLNVNIRALHFLMKQYISLMEKRGGRILNVASSAAFFSGPLLSSYYASKAYVLKLSSAVREELRRKKSPVTVTVFCPGPVKTEFGNISGCSDGKGAMTPEAAAKKAISGTLKGKRVVVPTFLTKCTHLLAKALPDSVTVRMVYRIQKSKGRLTAMKKLISFFAVLMLFSTSAAAQPIYTKTMKETVTGGVSRTNIQKFYGDYSLNIDLITADLKAPGLSLSLLKSPIGCDKVDTVMNLAKTENGVVAATNADFFSYYKDSQNFSLGIEMKDGQLLQSHINSDMAAGIFNGRELSFSYLDFKGTVTAPNGAVSALAHINKPTDYYGAVLMYTPVFNGGTSPFLPKGITAVTVVGDVVTAKGISLGGTIPIPQNSYILVIDDNMTPFLEYNFNIGDRVLINLSAADLIASTDTAFGGGTLLVKNSQKTPVTHKVNGNNPRTAIGTNADGTVVYLLTVDGRQKTSRGVTLEELADLCIELGMVHAMNFDGGGSTAMVGKTLSNEALHYFNSPSETRKVINAVAITTSAQKGETAGFIVSAASQNVLSGDSVRLYRTAYDANYNKPVSTPYAYEWRIKEGSGYVADDVYYAQGSGKTVIELYYNGSVTDTCTLNVINNVCGINAPAALPLTKGAATKIKDISVFDIEGNTAPVNNIGLLNPKYDSAFVSVTGDTVSALTEGSGSLILSYGSAKTGIKLTSGNYKTGSIEISTADPLYREESGGFSFNVMGFNGAGTLLDRLVFKKGLAAFKPANASAVIGDGLLSEFVGKVRPFTAQAWNEYNFDFAKLLFVDLTDKGVLARGSQWDKLDAALKGASQKNLIVLLDEAPSFEQPLDKAAFSKLLENAAKEKNVFVIYNGDKNFASIKNGVRYITVADSKDEGTAKATVNNFKYLSFNITSDTATYYFKNLYN